MRQNEHRLLNTMSYAYEHSNEHKQHHAHNVKRKHTKTYKQTITYRESQIRNGTTHNDTNYDDTQSMTH